MPLRASLTAMLLVAMVALAVPYRHAAAIGDNYVVCRQHYLRAFPLTAAAHGPFVVLGERLIGLGPTSGQWALVLTSPASAQLWAYLPDVVPTSAPACGCTS